MSIIIIIAIVVILAILIASSYNKLVARKNEIDNSFSQIKVQLKRRYDLIPNLVETAKAYMEHEKTTLENVIKARNMAFNSLKNMPNKVDNDSLSSLNNADASLQKAMSSMNFVMESYPDLKANENMMQLNEELSSTENRVAYARQAFNDCVLEYNNTRESFPTNIIANFFNFKPSQKMLEFEDDEQIQKAPKIKF